MNYISIPCQRWRNRRRYVGRVRQGPTTRRPAAACLQEGEEGHDQSIHSSQHVANAGEARRNRRRCLGRVRRRCGALSAPTCLTPTLSSRAHLPMTAAAPYSLSWFHQALWLQRCPSFAIARCRAALVQGDIFSKRIVQGHRYDYGQHQVQLNCI
jgi:hypothetical protein